MASEKELSDFLKEVEAKSFKRTVFATRDEEAALDIVQESMMKLAEKYGQQDISEIPLIFTRILQNTTLDWFRRQKTQNTWVSLFSASKGVIKTVATSQTTQTHSNSLNLKKKISDLKTAPPLWSANN